MKKAMFKSKIAKKKPKVQRPLSFKKERVNKDRALRAICLKPFLEPYGKTKKKTRPVSKYFKDHCNIQTLSPLPSSAKLATPGCLVAQSQCHPHRSIGRQLGVLPPVNGLWALLLLLFLFFFVLFLILAIVLNTSNKL